MYKTTILPLLLLLSIGCGDDSNDDGSSTEADGGDLVAADAGSEADAGIAPAVFGYAIGSDSTTSGILTEIALSDLEVAQGIVDGVVANDSVLRRFGTQLYIINRAGADNITIVDTETRQLVAQISTGPGTNPQDVAVVGDLLYVCAFNSGNIIVLDQTAPAAEPLLIDISAYDKDGVPNCSSIVEVDGSVYATLGLLDVSFTSTGGKVVVIDTADNTISSDFDLVNNNPFGLIEVSEESGAFGGDLLVPTTEDFGTGNGCIERITPGAAPASAGCLITNADLGGYVSKLQIQDGNVVAAVTTSFSEGKLVRIDAAGTLTEESITPATQQLADFAVCPSGDILTNDRITGSIRVFGSDDVERSGESGIDLGLPPAYTNGIVCF